MKRKLCIIFSGVIFACLGMFLIIMIVGAFRFASAFFTQTDPTAFEILAIAFWMIIFGVIGAVWYYCDTSLDEEK